MVILTIIKPISKRAYGLSIVNNSWVKFYGVCFKCYLNLFEPELWTIPKCAKTTKSSSLSKYDQLANSNMKGYKILKHKYVDLSFIIEGLKLLV